MLYFFLEAKFMSTLCLYSQSRHLYFMYFLLHFYLYCVILIKAFSDLYYSNRRSCSQEKSSIIMASVKTEPKHLSSEIYFRISTGNCLSLAFCGCILLIRVCISFCDSYFSLINCLLLFFSLLGNQIIAPFWILVIYLKYTTLNFTALQSTSSLLLQ